MDSTAYKLLMMAHVAAVVAAFAPAVVSPMLGQHITSEDGGVRARIYGYLAGNDRRVHGPALILAALFGIGLVLTSDDVWKFDQRWINTAFVVWFVMNGVLHGLVVPAEKKLAAGDESAQSRLQLGGMLMNLLFVVMLYLMVFKPWWPEN